MSRQRPTAARAALAAALAMLSVAGAMTQGTSPLPFTRADADQMLRKVAVIAVNGLSERPSSQRIEVTEQEVNAFLQFHAKDQIPAGVLEPTIAIDEAGRVSGRAIVDLDEVKQANGSSLGALSLMKGRLPVDAAGTLEASNGVARFTLESAHVGGMAVPKSVVQQVISYYSRSTENPEGIDIDAPFQLPARIRAIQIRRGQAVIVQ